MKNKIKYGLITLLIVMSTNSYGQNGFLSANHSYQIDGNELRLYLQANFSIGYGNICPGLDTFIVSTINNTISIDLYYDLRGAWPQAGCTSYDTSIVFIDTNFNAILVNTNTIEYRNSINDSVLNNVQTDTLVQSSLNTVEPFLEYKMKIFPNPSNNYLQIDVSNGVKIESIVLFNMEGKQVKAFNKDNKLLDISNLESGTYFLKLSTEEGELTKKVMIE